MKENYINKTSVGDNELYEIISFKLYEVLVSHCLKETILSKNELKHNFLKKEQLLDNENGSKRTFDRE
jgi:hypothetical protein